MIDARHPFCFKLASQVPNDEDRPGEGPKPGREPPDEPTPGDHGPDPDEPVISASTAELGAGVAP
jgi:hypothetical protein